MDNPLVSVIIPNYCHSKFLDERIESILHQTYQNFEIIILDDCSPDNGASKAVIEKYRDNPHVSHIEYNEQNSGSTFRQWNKGFLLAKGDFIWIAESDDSCNEVLLESLVKRLLLYPNASVAFSQCLAFVKEKGDMGHAGYYNDNDVVFNDYLGKNFFLTVGITNASCALIRKRCIEKIDKLFLNFKGAGDTMFWLELSLIGPIVYSKDGVNHFRRHIANSTKKFMHTGSNQREEKIIFDFMVNHLHPSKKDYNNYIKTYVRSRIFEMIPDKELKKELYKVWNFSKCQQIELRLEAWMSKLVKLLK